MVRGLRDGRLGRLQASLSEGPGRVLPRISATAEPRAVLVCGSVRPGCPGLQLIVVDAQRGDLGCWLFLKA